VKERPIIFSGESVRAAIDERKTQFRRVVKPQPGFIRWNPIVLHGYGGWTDGHGRPMPCPFGQPGDRLWVRETFQYVTLAANEYKKPNGFPRDMPECCCAMPDGTWVHRIFKADGDEIGAPWIPSIHMRVERLQDISAADAAAEGVQIPVTPDGHPVLCITERVDSHPLWKSPKTATLEDYQTGYFALEWNRINAKRGHSWDANDFVWVGEFEKLSTGDVDEP